MKSDLSNTETAHATTLPENVRIPLHSLQADLEYLIGRVTADSSCGPMVVKSMKDRLDQIESYFRHPAPGSCGCGPMCESKGLGNCRLHDVSPTRKALRSLVDAVWQHATESTAVPSTTVADKLITKMIIPSHDAPSSTAMTKDAALSHAEFSELLSDLAELDVDERSQEALLEAGRRLAGCSALRQALETAQEAIATLPMDALGYGEDDAGRWPLRDELLQSIESALSAAPVSAWPFKEEIEPGRFVDVDPSVVMKAVRDDTIAECARIADAEAALWPANKGSSARVAAAKIRRLDEDTTTPPRNDRGGAR